MAALSGFVMVLLWILAAAALVPRLGSRVLAAVRWPQIPIIGRARGLAASLILVAASFVVAGTANAIDPQPSAGRLGVASTLAPQSSGATTNAPVVPAASSPPIASARTQNPTAAASSASTITQAPATTAAATARPTIAPTPVQTPPPTPVSTLPPTQPPTLTPTPAPTVAPNLCGAPANPWNYTFCGGSQITAPPGNFCTYFNCIASFAAGKGYVVQCADLTFSKSGGITGSCSTHGGTGKTLYAP